MQRPRPLARVLSLPQPRAVTEGCWRGTQAPDAMTATSGSPTPQSPACRWFWKVYGVQFAVRTSSSGRLTACTWHRRALAPWVGPGCHPTTRAHGCLVLRGCGRRRLGLLLHDRVGAGGASSRQQHRPRVLSGGDRPASSAEPPEGPSQRRKGEHRVLWS